MTNNIPKHQLLSETLLETDPPLTNPLETDAFKQFFNPSPKEEQEELPSLHEMLSLLEKPPAPFTEKPLAPKLEKAAITFSDEELEIETAAPEKTLYIMPPSPYTPLSSNQLEQTNEVTPLSAVTADLIVSLCEHIGLLAHEITASGITQTSCVLSSPHSLLDNVEIVLSTYDTAPGYFNIEINSCDKLHTLLQKAKNTLVTQVSSSGLIKVARLDFNGQTQILAKDKIEGTTRKKVTEAK